MKLLLRLAIGVFVLAGMYAALLSQPQALFSHDYQYKQFSVYSDRVIEPEIVQVLDKVERNIMRSELYDPAVRFKIFICNADWRLLLLTRNSNVGGSVAGVISPNIFIRDSDISKDRIIPPGGWMYDAENRPLSYFISHEAAHAMQARYDRFLMFKLPTYALEGYAEYIGKGQPYHFDKARAQLVAGHEFMQESSPLYDRYQLYTGYLMGEKGYTFKAIAENPPPYDKVMQEVRELEDGILP